MEEREELEETGGPAEQTFTWPLLGALYGSLMIVAVVALLASGAGRRFENEVDAPARTLVAAPVVLFAVVLFLASIVALIAPAYRRASLRVAEIAGWLIPAWLVMCAMGIGAVAFALHHAS
jgi:low temperature requirement protein LtrA